MAEVRAKRQRAYDEEIRRAYPYFSFPLFHGDGCDCNVCKPWPD